MRKGLPRQTTRKPGGRAAKTSSGRRKEPAVYKRRRSEYGEPQTDAALFDAPLRGALGAVPVTACLTAPCSLAGCGGPRDEWGAVSSTDPVRALLARSDGTIDPSCYQDINGGWGRFLATLSK